MTETQKQILQMIKDEQVPGVQFLQEPRERRILLDVDVDRLANDDTIFNQLREQDPPKLDVLTASTKETGGPINPPTLFVELVDDAPVFYVTDGHQRVRSAKSNGIKRILCWWILDWTTKDQALKESVALNFGITRVGEADAASILATGRLTTREVAERTGISEDKLGIIRKMVETDDQWLYAVYRKGAINMSQAKKLLKAADDDGVKLAAARKTLEHHLSYAQREQKKALAEKDRAKGKRIDRELMARTKLSYYFKDFDHDGLIAAVEQDEVPYTLDGRIKLDGGGAASSKLAVRVSTSRDEWRKKIAVYNLFGQDIEDIDRADLDEVLERWDYIHECLIAIRNDQEPPAFNETRFVETPFEPTAQEPDEDFDASDETNVTEVK